MTEEIIDFLMNNTICKVQRKVNCIEYDKESIYFILTAINGNEMKIGANDFKNNNYIKNKIVLDFETLFETYNKEAKNILIQRKDLHSFDNLCYSIKLKKDRGVSIAHFGNELNENYKYVCVQMNFEKDFKRIEDVGFDIYNALKCIINNDLKNQDKKAIIKYPDFNDNFDEAFQTNNMNIKLYDYTDYSFKDSIPMYTDQISKHNKDIAEAKKMQMKFNGM